MINTKPKGRPDWPRLVRQYRESLELSMENFGVRYKVTRQTVFYWEKGRNEIPGKVSWDIMQWLNSKEGK